MTRPPDWRHLATESQNDDSRGLDRRSTVEIVELLAAEDRRGLDAVIARSAAIAEVADRVALALEAGRDLVFAGAGTSGRLGVIEAAECPPTFGSDPGRIRAVIAGGEEAVFRAQEGVEDDPEAGAAVGRAVNEGDVVIGISASSVTRWVRGVLEAAKDRGAHTVLLTCAPADQVEALGLSVDHVIALGTGPEVLTGSTRLKAGSATKAALNGVTTAAMVRLGKVYDNLMVDLRPGSAKLRDRSARIVEAAGEVSTAEAKRLYREADREVKTAIVMARTGKTAVAARAALRAAGGHVRVALEQ